MPKPARFTSGETAGAARAALWAALVAAGAFVSLPLGPVPITLQTFFILLCGFSEGTRAWRPVALYVAAGVLGFPVFSGGVAGPAVLAGPTAGFALAFPLSAYVAGLAVRGGRRWPALVLYGLLSTAIVNACGAVGLHVNLGLPWDRAFLAVTPFLPGGALKIAAAAACAPAVAGRLGLGGGVGTAGPGGAGDVTEGLPRTAWGPDRSSGGDGGAASLADVPVPGQVPELSPDREVAQSAIPAPAGEGPGSGPVPELAPGRDAAPSAIQAPAGDGPGSEQVPELATGREAFQSGVPARSGDGPAGGAKILEGMRDTGLKPDRTPGGDGESRAKEASLADGPVRGPASGPAPELATGREAFRSGVPARSGDGPAGGANALEGMRDSGRGQDRTPGAGGGDCPDA
ncbi:MAG: biotin transporter BioY [Deltaproteobacteria bacterium]|jgi:biotin transport system substrate-specific component|nr:biotin transporter BioY [Deltaproteobacteria bacterium]